MCEEIVLHAITDIFLIPWICFLGRDWNSCGIHNGRENREITHHTLLRILLDFFACRTGGREKLAHGEEFSVGRIFPWFDIVRPSHFLGCPSFFFQYFHLFRQRRFIIDISVGHERCLGLEWYKTALRISRYEINRSIEILPQATRVVIWFDGVRYLRKLCWSEGRFCSNAKIIHKVLCEIGLIFEMSFCDIAAIKTNTPAWNKSFSREFIN